MTTEDDFQRALDANPNDWQTLLVFSDWLRERDDPRADGYAALARQRKHPGAQSISHRPDRGWAGDWFVWAKAGQATRGPGKAQPWEHDALPPDWYDGARKYNELPGWDPLAWSYFRARSGALDAAAFGFATLPAERRAELLAGMAEQPPGVRKSPPRQPKKN